MRPLSLVSLGLFLALLVPGLAPLAAADHSLREAERTGIMPLPVIPGADRLVHRQTNVDLAFARWEAAWPDFVDRMVIGKTVLGNDMHAVRITDETVAFDAAALATGQKLRVYLDGNHHGNEYMGTELIMYWLEDVLTRAGSGDEATLELLRVMEIYATPIINVEGNLFDTRKNARQVDLNRNYPYEFGGPGSGASVSAFTYRGPAPLSEPESKANAEFGALISPDVWMTMHSGVAEFYWPWGWTSDPSPDDEMFSKLEAPFEEATNGRVDAMQAAELYLAAGATDDFGYGALGIATFTYEAHEDQFLPVYGRPIPEIIAAQLAGVEWIVRNTKTIGAWLEPALVPGGLAITNEGWGRATNVTLLLPGRAEMRVEDVEPGATLVIALSDADASQASVRYNVLLIETSRTRTTAPLDDSLQPLSVPSNAVPTPGFALAAGAIAAALLLRRARRQD